MTVEMIPAPRLSSFAPRTYVTRGSVARALVHHGIRRVPVRLHYPDGKEVGGGDNASPVLELVRPEAFYRRVESNPKLGLGEAFMAGDWRAANGTDLAALLTPFAERLPSFLPRPIARFRALTDRPYDKGERNSISGARANVAAHYDLPEVLFSAFLDKTMTYSSALFDEDSPWAAQSLADAQRRKVEAVLDRARVGAGTRLLEIGSGWGELAIAAAARGAQVTTVTLSRKQRDFVSARLYATGLVTKVDVRLQDYREVQGQFDSIVSVEMIESVGEEFWPTYFQTIDRLLTPGGVVAIQSILMQHDRFLATRRSSGWIQKYVFPGGIIPSLPAVDGIVSSCTALDRTSVFSFGRHYAETLRRWRQEFLANWDRLLALGFDEVFRRRWEFYLAYCEAGFASGYLDVAQITFERS